MSDDVQRCRCGFSMSSDATGTRCGTGCKYDAERREFIRGHAQALDAAYIQGLAITGRELTMLEPKRSWELARELWDAKPEDC